MPHQEIILPTLGEETGSLGDALTDAIRRARPPKRGLLSRIGQGLVSFGSGIPQSEIETIRSRRDIAANQAELGQQEIEANQQEIQKQQEIQQLSTIAFDPANPDNDKALTRLFQIAPEFAGEVQKGLRIEDQAGFENAARRAASIQAQPTKELRDAEIRKQINDNPNLDLTETAQMLDMTFEQQEIPLRVTQAAALSAKERFLLPADTETTKTFREGNNFVTRKIVNGRPDMSDAGILSSSPIDRIQRIETGDPGAFTGKTPSQQGAAIEDFQNAAIGGLSAIQTGAELLQIAAETPEALGVPGTIVRAGNEFIRTAEALGSLMGVDVGADRSADDFTFEGFSGNLRNTAIESQAFRSGIYGIAFAAAVAEQGSRPSDKDIQAFIDQIAGSTADPLAFRRTIGTFVNRINRRLRSTAAIKGIPDQISARAFDEIDAALEQFGQVGKSQAELLSGFDDLSAEDQRELIEAIRRNPALLQGLQ